MEHMEGVDSSSIRRISYEEYDSLLEVEFHNGGVYQYLDVPIHVWTDFKEAASKGIFLNSIIKGAYRFMKV